MPVEIRPTDGFFIIQNGEGKGLGKQQPASLDRRTAFGIPLWAFLINLPGGGKKASTFRASSRGIAVARARRRVEREKLPRAILAKFVGRRRSDNERVFEDVLELRFKEK